MEIQDCTLELVEKNQVAPNILFLTYKLVTPQSLERLAGQYLSMRVHSDLLRNYSICNPPTETTTIQNIVDVTPGGPGSQYLLGLKPGDKVSARAPIGNFTLESLPIGSAKAVVFCATGTGVGPFKAMVPELVKKEVEVYLYFGLRSEKDMYFQDYFRELAQKYPNFKFNPVLSRPDSDSWTGLTGHVTEYVLSLCDSLLARKMSAKYYLCGNMGMIRDLDLGLRAKEVDRNDIHFESYYETAAGSGLTPI